MLALIGAMVSVAGVVAFRRTKTTVDDTRKSCAHSCPTAFIDSAITDVSGIPATASSLCGSHTANVVGLLGLLVFVIYMNRFQIAPTGENMRAKFGNSFAEYEKSVRRWL